MDLHFNRNFDGKRYLLITYGYNCGDRSNCMHKKECKHKDNYKFHNLSVDIHRFFEYRLHIKLPHLIYIGKKYKRLSGTDMCPYKMSRNYTCYDCKYVCGELLRECNCKERNDTPYNERQYIENEDWGSKCAYFEKDKYADGYKIIDK